MQLGALVPFTDTGGDPSLVRDFAQSLEALDYDFLEAPDHVLGARPASNTGTDERRTVSDDMFHDPFVLLGYLSAATTKLQFSTGVLIVAQRQTALVAKQAACLDILSGGCFRLGIGVGWNPRGIRRPQREFPQPRPPVGGTSAGHASAVGAAICVVQGQIPHHRRRRHQSTPGLRSRPPLV